MLKINKDAVSITIEELMEMLDTDGNLSVVRWPNLKSLPEGIVIEGMVLIRDCPELETLPAIFAVMGGRFSNLPNLVEIPEGISTNGLIQVTKCDKVKSLHRLTGGTLDVRGCLAVKKVVHDNTAWRGLSVLGCPQYVA